MIQSSKITVGTAETILIKSDNDPQHVYVSEFVNLGNQTTNVLLQLGFSEQYNGQHDLHLGAAGSAAVIRGGESMEFDLFPGDTLVGQTTDLEIEVGVMRQVY